MNKLLTAVVFFSFFFSVQALVINEFLASNATILPDEWDEYDDWLEIFNSSSSSVNISGYYLSDDYAILDKWVFPVNTTIPANGYIIVWVDDDEETQGPLHASFKLSAGGDNIIISDASLTIVDDYAFGPQTTDISEGRFPNGTGDFSFMAPSPAQSNEKDLVINEFLAANETILADEWGEYDDWLELYNSSSSSINLSGYYLSDDLALLDKWQFPGGVSIAANSYLLVWLDGDDGQGPLHTNFSLGAAGEDIIICDINLNIIDIHFYGAQTTDISMGRYPNGTGSFIYMTPTPLLTNLSGVPVSQEEIPPAGIELSNYPNPFNPSTTISFELNTSLRQGYAGQAEISEDTELEIYNLKGQKVKTFSNLQITQSPNQQIIWEGTDQTGQPVTSGMYFYKLNIHQSPIRKMILVK